MFTNMCCFVHVYSYCNRSSDQSLISCTLHVVFQLLESAMRPDTVLVSVMTVNNEIGVRQPVEDIGKHASSYIIK